ncbi:unnamed protein product, partial [Mesorhabditis belari]|uniref:Glucosidase II subunit alpha n=1 Tax=Mesorhabditis belari TaxID=2138241 RepID=A0AAF3F2P0_9BILA
MRRETWLLAAVLVFAMAVKREDFKTCDQATFCKRHRSISENTGYAVDFSTVQHSGAILTATLKGPENELSLKLTGLDGGRVRLQIDEPAGALRKRFIPEFALSGVQYEVPFDKVDVQSDYLTIHCGGSKAKVVIHQKPFLVDIYNGLNELVTQVNAAGKLKVEHFRAKMDGQEYPEGFWDESFKHFRDSKPFGSSSVGVDVSFVGFRHAFGLPSHADAFSLRSTVNNGEPYRLFNLDVFEYELDNTMALYAHVPYIIAHKKQRSVGFLWLNAAETWVDTRSSEDSKGMFRTMLNKVMADESQPRFDAHFMAEAGLIDLFFFVGPSSQDVQKQMAETSGVTPIPPLFAIAYHQCRWNYNDEQDVAQVNAGFDEWDIPMDVIWLDIEHTDGKKYFTWHPTKFATPKKMIEGVASKGRKMVTIIDPHIKRDDSYRVNKDAKDLGLFVKKADGTTDFEGHCWPGSSEYLDFFHPKTREYWAQQFAFDRYEGSTRDLHTWNDMNEPSVFSGPEVTMDRDAIHYGGIEHREVHNMYGMMYTSATYKGLVERTAGKDRPFLLSRAGFIGTQRTAAIWTGDNTAEWGHLRYSVPMLLQLSVAGIPFVGADVGGFFGNPDEQLLLRWYQAGAYQPFFRAHAHIDTRRREPWLFSDETREGIRDAIRQRYTLLPYWYTLFQEHNATGMPPMRPIFYEFPSDEALFTEDKAHMVGEALLVRAVVDKDATSVEVTLPSGENKDTLWYDWESGVERPAGLNHVDAPLQKIPVFQRGGTIVPTWQRIRRAASLMKEDPLTLIIALDKNGAAKGRIYLDDMETFDYKNLNNFCISEFSYATNSPKEAKITGKHADSNGAFKPVNWVERIEVRGVPSEPSKVISSRGLTLPFAYDRDARLLSIRKPGDFAGEDWTITLNF